MNPNITFQINYDDDGNALIVIFEDEREYARHQVRGDIANQWARQEVAYIRERRAEEAEWLSRDDSARLDY